MVITGLAAFWLKFAPREHEYFCMLLVACFYLPVEHSLKDDCLKKAPLSIFLKKLKNENSSQLVRTLNSLNCMFMLSI